ncbi:MAG: phosphatidate cytidylyltransferase [Gammaproteobacteria bacterium]|nr:phosphatidate cytidylyltransferase [Gammaproteobacteria bacterium]
MLKPRIFTALILIPIVIAAVFFMPPLTFFSLALLVILLAGWEWSILAELPNLTLRIGFLVLLAAVLVLSVFVPLYVIISLAVVWWLIAITLLAIYPRGKERWGNSIWIRSLIGFLVLTPCWVGLIILQGFSPIVLMYCLILIWGADTAAYFAGKKWGQHKLAPAISPGKTYEGFIGGLIAAAVIAGVGFWVLRIPSDRGLLFFIVSVIGGGLISVIGDLFESMMKRQSHIKDSGSILPGHGGLLDRIDSMTTAIPFFALFFPYLFN